MRDSKHEMNNNGAHDLLAYEAWSVSSDLVDLHGEKDVKFGKF